jgi:hypothetical protein
MLERRYSATGVLREVDGAAGGGALGGGIGQLEGLLDGQVRQPLDFEDAAGEDVLLAFLLHRQQALLDRVVGDGMNQVAQGDARLHLALEAHQHGLRHVQRHHAGGGREGHQAGAGGEGDTHGEAGVRVASGAHRIRQQHAVQPAVDDAVAGAQGDAAAGHDEVRQRVLGVDVHRLRVRGRVAEALHGQIRGEAQAGEVLELVPGHGSRGVLGADGGHRGSQ